MQAEFEYQQLLLQTMSHEQLTPLNAVLNISDIMIKESGLSPEHVELLKVIWSSGKILEFNIKSQLSQMKIQSDCGELNYEKTSRADVQRCVDSVLEPF